MPRFEPGAYYMQGPLSLGVAKSKNKGTPYLWIAGDITQVADNGGWSPVAQAEQRQVDLYLSDGAMPITQRQLEPLGFNGDLTNPSLSAEKMNGIIVYCTHEDYNGKPQERWSLDGGGRKRENVAADANEIRRLNALWRSSKAAGPVAPTMPPPAAPTMPPPPTGDEIPF